MAYYLKLNPLPRYLYGAFRKFKPQEKHVNRKPEYSVLLLMLEGSLIFYEDGIRREVKENQWYIQRANRLQEGVEPSLTPKYFYIHFDGDFFQQNEISVPEETILATEGEFNPLQIKPYLNRMEVLQHRVKGAYLEKQSIFYEVLNFLQKSHYKDQKGYVTANQIGEYLGSCFASPLRLKDLAEKFHYSQDHIIRLFKTYYQMTPHQYLTAVRVTVAQQLILSTERPLREIAQEVGFGDESAFYKAFRQQTGKTPKQWEKEIKGYL